jgi:DNA-binding NarL/FixJ family response regulator
MMYDATKPIRRGLLLEYATAVLIERPVATRRLLRSALHNIGLRELRELDQMPEAGAETDLFRAVDLLVVDLSEEDCTGAALVTNIRRRVAALNPFIITIATSFTATSTVINSAVNAGTDGILLKPFSQQQIYDQILHVIERRRPFIVTANYIGPERRPQKRPDSSSAPAIDVPNTLRDKLIQGRYFNIGESVAAIESTWGRVNREFNLRGAFQILYLIRLAKAATEDPTEDNAAKELARLRNATRELLSRIAGTELHDVATELADWISHRLDLKAGAGNGRALDQIAGLTAALICLLGSEAAPEELIRQADRAALEYRARQLAKLGVSS